ncbi:hypothetical protein KR026_009229 [Drosophila bipectinata]|nr:hypothetical protein KR026_009229 [Drosophila bipectinata]
MEGIEEFQLNQHQLVSEINRLIRSTQAPTDTNALLLNQELQRRLHQVRDKILHLLQIVKARYDRNQEILKRRMQPRSRYGQENLSLSGAILRKGTFHFKGNLYFRDIDGRSCPNNEDYDSRCLTEMFPTDFDMRSRHVWTLLDKKNVIMGIKQQLLDHCKEQDKPSIKRKRRPIERHVQSLASLLGSADSNFSIDWNQISIIDLEYRHSAYSCEAMWRFYLHPDRNRGEWTQEEDDNLLAVATANGMQNWEVIASYTDRRSDYQCFVRINTNLRHLIEPSTGNRWTEEENDRLRTMVQKHSVNGITNWNKVLEYFPGRSKSTIIGRYMYVLHPSISHAPFTAKEDMMLFAAVEEYNGKFNCFPRSLFPNRSLAQLRTRYHNTLAQRNKTDAWSVEDDNRLMEFVTENGTSQWLSCATFLGNHSRTSCRTRFLVIKRFLEQNPTASVEDLPRRRSRKVASVTAENWAQCLQEWQEDPDSIAKMEIKPKSRAKRPKITKPDNPKMGKVEAEFHDYFKYGYNLQLLTPVTFSLPKDKTNLAYAAKALSYYPPVRPQPLLGASMPEELQESYNQMIGELPKERILLKSTLLPPNWSTMMGFRALCILSGDCRKMPEKELVYNESDPPIQLFRQRLRALFYRTTLLSRLESQLFTQLPSCLRALPRPTPKFVQMGENINCAYNTPKENLKSEPLSEDETAVTVTMKEETEVEYIVP